MPSVQSPYTIAYGSAAGSVYSIDCGGLALAGVHLLAGTPGVLTIETAPYPSAPAASYGTLAVVQETSVAGTAQTLAVAGTIQAYRWTHQVGPLYEIRATVVGSVQTAGTLAVYLRG
jgi:hypothetical protein